MRRSKRYEIIGDWRMVGDTEVQSFWIEHDDPVRVTREVADIKDTVGGRHYSQGAYRVDANYVDVPGANSYARKKTFYGEFAWADSRRLYEDIINTVRHNRDEG